MNHEPEYQSSGQSPGVPPVQVADHPTFSRAQPAPAATAKPYLTPAEVADLLGVSEKTISRWSLEDASMPVFRRGRVVRFPRERLIAWLERQEPRSARRMA